MTYFGRKSVNCTVVILTLCTAGVGASIAQVCPFSHPEVGAVTSRTFIKDVEHLHMGHRGMGSNQCVNDMIIQSLSLFHYFYGCDY